jgi:iron(III) transport system ATP-binding protein
MGRAVRTIDSGTVNFCQALKKSNHKRVGRMNLNNRNSEYLRLSDVSASYDADLSIRQTLSNINFALPKGAIGALLGSSGCGKTTVLRAIAGFIPLSSGLIQINNRSLSTPTHTVEPQSRGVGMVFQDYALFPHLTVYENVIFGVSDSNHPEARSWVQKLLKVTRLDHLKSRYMHELSGGQQQRVALVRAMAPQPSLLLMDEPFSNIDSAFRETLALDIAQLCRDKQMTVLFVTHDQQEAFMMADYIGVMDQGCLREFSEGYTLYHQPRDRHVARFIGQSVFVDGVITERKQHETDGIVYVKVKTELGHLEGCVEDGFAEQESVDVMVRPDDILHDDCSVRKARILSKRFLGASYLYKLALTNGEEVLAMVHSHHDHDVGEAFGIKIELAHLVIFKKEHSA